MNSKLKLPEVTLICVTGVQYQESIFALYQSSKKIEFADIKIISPTKPSKLPKKIHHEFPYETKLENINEYNRYMIYNLWRHVSTSHCLVIQADGYVINQKNWDEIFLQYDYIGAPWPISEEAYIDPFGRHQRVGNGGFSLRSQKLLLVPENDNVPWEINDNNFYRHMGVHLYSEDGNICVHNRHIFEKNGCRFAPLEIAAKFSIESPLEDLDQTNPFGFHKLFPNKKLRIRHFIDYSKFKLSHLLKIK